MSVLSEKMPLMRAENITRLYPDGSVTALRGVDLSIYEGDCIAILGKSGSGKSTLMHILGGCDDPSAGVVYWRGEPVRGQEAARDAAQREREDTDRSVHESDFAGRQGQPAGLPTHGSGKRSFSAATRRRIASSFALSPVGSSAKHSVAAASAFSMPSNSTRSSTC